MGGFALRRQRTCFTHLYAQQRGTGRSSTWLPADHMSSTTVSPAPGPVLGTQDVLSKRLMNETPHPSLTWDPSWVWPQAWGPSCTALIPKPSSASTEASIPQKGPSQGWHPHSLHPCVAPGSTWFPTWQHGAELRARRLGPVSPGSSGRHRTGSLCQSELWVASDKHSN